MKRQTLKLINFKKFKKQSVYILTIPIPAPTNIKTCSVCPVCPTCEKKKKKQKEYNKKYQIYLKQKEATEYFQSEIVYKNYPILKLLLNSTFSSIPNSSSHPVLQEDQLWKFYAVFLDPFLRSDSKLAIYIDVFNELFINPLYPHVPSNECPPYFSTHYVKTLLTSRKILLKYFIKYKECANCKHIKQTWYIPNDPNASPIFNVDEYENHFLENPYTKHQPEPYNFRRSKSSYDGWSNNCIICEDLTKDLPQIDPEFCM